MIRRRRRQCRSPMRRRSPFRLSGTREIWLLKWKPHSAAAPTSSAARRAAGRDADQPSWLEVMRERSKNFAPSTLMRATRTFGYFTIGPRLGAAPTQLERANWHRAAVLSLPLSLSNRARSGGSYLEVLRHDHPRFVLPLSRTLMPIDREGEGGRSGDSLRSP